MAQSIVTTLWQRLIRWGFHLLYNQLAWTYDFVSWTVSLGQWRQWQLAALPFIEGKKVLEIAHGPGHMLVALARAGYDVTGIDLSPTMVRMARRRVRHAQTPVVQGRVQALPFAAETFDSILSTFPTPFITQPETLATARRCLRPGGVLVIVPDGNVTGGALAVFIDWLYILTGQRKSAENSDNVDAFWQSHLLTAGFSSEQHMITLPRSTVTVVVARKTGVESP